ncbi:hypothetical protein [Thiorhodovibrio frisius]|uniref:hypothetical protein n=1 Tax=Thiorhodovibrio frisius TaxID=631362 RepID=UPI00022C69AF|nr:hypothetical protein [Thiorhodovibrio frisius]WPL23836.1 hypothetical protein Thiofri_04042 [Thiorhodovibrio frisius]
MQAIELEATVEQHSIRVPETIQDGTHLRVLLLMDDPPANASRTDDDLKRRLAGLTEGLSDEDLHRARDVGRSAGRATMYRMRCR